ncbi:hypothetical protein [Desulfovibrio inopinatus]|uniref:hypothetical protein n=1 Tax=Desulfovibrio inopinatus TaxID=102109 RepID=UPI0003FDF557|nr:hypothetical protein [Desulfovibrio inopinatus]
MSDIRKPGRYLRNPRTGVVWPWTQALSRRSDLVEVVVENSATSTGSEPEESVSAKKPGQGKSK